jgi:hypothetical protein
MEIKQWFRKMSFDTAEKVVAKKAKITNTTFLSQYKKTASQKTNKQFSSKKLYLLTLQLIISKQ